MPYVHNLNCKIAIEDVRRNRGEGRKIKGCRKSRIISFFPDGTWQIKRHICSCSQCRIEIAVEKHHPHKEETSSIQIHFQTNLNKQPDSHIYIMAKKMPT